jgi:hypothetical protein
MRHDFEKTLGESQLRWYSVYLLYWYKSTNTDAAAAVAFSPNGAFLASGSGWLKSEGPHFTCFPGTKVQIQATVQPSLQWLVEKASDVRLRPALVLKYLAAGTKISQICADIKLARDLRSLGLSSSVAGGLGNTRGVYEDNSVRVWSVADGSLMSTLVGHSAAVRRNRALIEP